MVTYIIVSLVEFSPNLNTKSGGFLSAQERQWDRRVGCDRISAKVSLNVRRTFALAGIEGSNYLKNFTLMFQRLDFLATALSGKIFMIRLPFF